MKTNSVKQEFEKQDELKRSALRAVTALLTIPDAGEFFYFVGFCCVASSARRVEV